MSVVRLGLKVNLQATSSPTLISYEKDQHLSDSSSVESDALRQHISNVTIL
jgi:hypothetical protein